MTNSRTFRVAFVGSLIVAIVGMIALSGWLLWPALLRDWAIGQIESAGLSRDQERCLGAVETLDKLQAGEVVAGDLLAHSGYSTRDWAEKVLIHTDDDGTRARVLAGKL